MPSADEHPELTLVLPCYNEAEHIEDSVPRIVEVLDVCRWSYEIIFVDDESQDNTRELIQELLDRYPDHRMSAIFHEQNTGRGGAVSDGFRAASGEVVGYIDIDLEVGPHYIIPCMLALQNGADVAVAHRIYRLRPRAFFRHVLSRGYSTLTARLLGWPFRDTESGYKFMWRRTALDLLQYVESTGWFWDTEIMYYAHHLGYRVVELPSLFLRRQDKTSTVKPIRDSLDYWWNLIRFLRRQRTNPSPLPHPEAARDPVNK